MKLWKWLSGKKTAISVMYGAILMYCQSKGYVDPELLILLSTIGGVLFGIGAGHKLGKAMDGPTQ